MKLFTILLLLSTFAFAGPVKKADLQPNVDEPMVPGTKVPIERMNTAPTSPELAPEDKEFRDTLEARKQKQQELIQESKEEIQPRKTP